jgi:hypothetical protein
MDDLKECLASYKTDQDSWYEGKKDVLVELFDDYVSELYENMGDQFAVDLIHLGHAMASGADKLELRLKLGRLVNSGRGWLKYSEPL